LLHLDLWIDGCNVLADPGTYRYTAAPPWGNALADRRVHNVPSGDGAGQRRLGRFLPLSWPTAECLRHDTTSGVEVVVLRARADRSTFRRTVVRRGDAFVVVDDANGDTFTTRWTFGVTGEVEPTNTGAEVAAGTGRVRLHGDVRLLRADEDDPTSAWIADGYAQRRATTALTVRSGGRPLVALLGPADSPLPHVEVDAIAAGELVPHQWLPV
ncbi:MAG: heparinase II/III-family protein, partial [Actinomycetota bacterium]|nr:heparinase II/III-family protein [Actinomycetota bacterium]